MTVYLTWPTARPLRGSQLAGLMLGLLIANGCGGGGLSDPALYPTQAPEVDVVRTVYSATLGDAEHGPPARDDPVGALRYVSGGGLEIELKQPRSYTFVPPKIDAVRDMRVEVDVEFRSALVSNGNLSPSAGVVCRWSTAEWFYFGIWTSGDAAIYRMRGSIKDAIKVPATGPAKIVIDGALHVKADCVGGEGSPIFLTLDVNGTRLLSAHDNVPGGLSAPAAAGILLASGNQSNVTVRYRNLSVRELRVVH